MQRTLWGKLVGPKKNVFNSRPYNIVSSLVFQIDLVTTGQEKSWLITFPSASHKDKALKYIKRLINHILAFVILSNLVESPILHRSQLLKLYNINSKYVLHHEILMFYTL